MFTITERLTFAAIGGFLIGIAVSLIAIKVYLVFRAPNSLMRG